MATQQSRIRTAPSTKKSSAPKPDMMSALVYHGPLDVRVELKPKPVISSQTDALVKVTKTTICGSDLHLYHGAIPDTRSGDILGHESLGFVEKVGSDVKKFKPGDRVVISAVIGCCNCWYCRQKLFSLCDRTNVNPKQEMMYGQHTGGIFGYSHMVGGYDGGQAEYIRVPFADVNLLNLPPEAPDDIALLLSDILCTGWHANECGQVKEGESVAIWGCGPVGLMSAMWAKFRGAKTVVIIDRIPYRLAVAKEKLGITALNFEEEDPQDAIRRLTNGRGPDVCIEAVGYRYSKSWFHSAEKAIKLETDGIDALSECIRTVRKAGRVAVIGDFIGYANHFPVGAFMEKGVCASGGQVLVQKYWQELLRYILEKRVDPSFVISHHIPFSRCAEAYATFDRKEQNALKIILDVTPDIDMTP